MDFSKFISRKLIVTVLGMLAGFLGWGDIPPEVSSWIAGIIIMYIGGQSVVDAVEASSTGKKKSK